MTIYLLLIIFYYCMSFSEDSRSLDNKSKRIRSFILILPMFLLTAFRGINVGTDTTQYYRIYYLYNSYSELLSRLKTSEIEPGYLILNYIGNHLGLSYNQFQIIVALIIYAAIYYISVKYSSNTAYFCFLLMTTRTMFSIMNISRSWIATSLIIICSIKFIEKRKPILFCLSVIAVSLLIHKSAIVFLLLYPVAHTRINRKKIYALLASTFIAFLFGKRFFNLMIAIVGKYDSFVENGYNETGLAVIMNLAMHACFLIIIIKMYYTVVVEQKNANNKEDVSYNIMVPVACSIIVICIDIIGLRLNVANRVSIHFTPLFLISISNAFALMKKDKGYYLLKLIVSGMLIAYFVIILVYRSNWNSVVPYTTFFTAT